MQQSILLISALAVGSALAAPTPTKRTETKGNNFVVSVKGKGIRHGNPAQEMQRAYRKFGWELVMANAAKSNSLADDLTGDLGLGSLTDGITDGLTDGFDPTSITDPLESQLSSFLSPLISDLPTPTPVATSEPAPFAASNTTSATTMATSTMSASMSSSMAASQTGSDTSEVTASPESNDAEYLVPVSIGGQTLNLDFDTGSADLWVFSTELSQNEIGGHTAFDKSKSSSWEEYDGASWKIAYGDGSGASGDVGFDSVAIGAATATHQAVELATQVSDQFIKDTDNDGLLGLSFSKINTVKPQTQTTWFDTIKGDLQAPVFTADLEKDASGTYEFGKIDDSKYTGDVHYAPVDASTGFWQFESPSYTVGGQTYSCKTCSPAIADTGTSLVLVDDDVAKAYYSQVQGSKNDAYQGGYTYPCDADLPDFGVAIGPDFVANLKGNELTYAQIDGQTCFGGIQSNSKGDMQIFGDVMFKQYFAIFDDGNKQFGVATKA